MNMKTGNREKTIYKVTWVGFFANLVLSIAKLLAGIFGRSGAMIADAVHSISDFATDVVVLAFVKVSAKPKDEGHDYGHGKYETLATVIIGLALFAVGVGILINSIELIRQVVDGVVIERPGLIALVAAAVSIVVKEALYWYTILAARRVNSPAMEANAWHHRSDAFSSIGTLIGIGGAYFLGEQWRVLDPIAA
ncbi:MAG TPA: cation diffusion facilitator family transporter, partial [Paludibacteraceae bacterium]|nr:cation diffusion facilitator family transporter [Paludibacteraceae bacterium]